MMHAMPASILVASESLPPGALDLMNRLHDIERPPAPGFWPPAPGWWVLAIVLLGLTMALAVWTWRRHARRQPASQALRELGRWRQHAAGQAPDRAAAELSALLKRLALCHYPRPEVAALSGTSWLEFLDRTGTTTAFTQGPGTALGDARFRPDFSLEVEPLADLAQDWIRAQRRRSARRQA